MDGNVEGRVGNDEGGQRVLRGPVHLRSPGSKGTRRGPTPEELIGAANAGCFSMFLAAQLTNAGKPPKSIETSATVTLGEGPTITKIELADGGGGSGPGPGDLRREGRVQHEELPGLEGAGRGRRASRSTRSSRAADGSRGPARAGVVTARRRKSLTEKRDPRRARNGAGVGRPTLASCWTTGSGGGSGAHGSRGVALACAALAYTACSTIDVRTDYAHGTDFGRYRTFALEKGAIVAQGVPDTRNTLVRDRIDRALRGRRSPQGAVADRRGARPARSPTSRARAAGRSSSTSTGATPGGRSGAAPATTTSGSPSTSRGRWSSTSSTPAARSWSGAGWWWPRGSAFSEQAFIDKAVGKALEKYPPSPDKKTDMIAG